MRKHNNMKRSTALALAFSLLLALLLPGCDALSSGGKTTAPAKDWDTTINITDAFNDVLEEALGDDSVKVKDFSIDVTVSVDDDGEYELTVDEKRLERTLDNVMENLFSRKEAQSSMPPASGTQESFPAGLSDDRIVGNWVCSMDVTDMLIDEMESSLGDEIEYFSFHNFILKLNLSLSSGGTFRLTIDEAAWNRTFNTFVDDVVAGLEAYFDVLADEEGIDMTLEEYLEDELGYTMDEFVEELLEEAGLDGMDVASAINISGTYEADGSELIVTSSSGTNTLSYTLSGNQLTIHSDTGGMLGDTMVFTKK